MYANTVGVTAAPASGGVVTATDVSRYRGAVPEVTVRVEVSGDGGESWTDADEAPGPSLLAGGAWGTARGSRTRARSR